MKFTRRSAMRALITSGVGLLGLELLAACGGTAAPAAPTTAPSAAKPAAAPTTAAATTAPASVTTPRPATGATTTAPAAPTKAAATGQIQLVSHMRDSEEEAFAKRTNEFNAANPSLKATFEFFPGDYYAKLKTVMAAGTPGDVIYAHTSNMAYQQFAVGNTTIPIDAYISKDKVDVNQWYPQGINAMKLDGKIYGLPVRGQVAWLFMFYNAELFKKAGLDLPNDKWTNDDIVNAGRKITKRTGETVDVWGLATNWGGYENIPAHLRRWNAEFWDPKDGGGTKVTVASPEGVSAYQWLYDLWYKERTMAPASEDTGKAWKESRLGLHIMHLAGVRASMAAGAGTQFEWGMTVMPKGPTGRRGGFLSTDTLTITKASKNQDEAFKLLTWYTNRDSGIAAALQSKGSLTPGFRPDVYCSPELLGDKRFPMQAMQSNCDNASVNESYTFPANLRINELQDQLNQFQKPILEGKQEPSSSYLTQMQAALQKVADQPRLG